MRKDVYSYLYSDPETLHLCSYPSYCNSHHKSRLSQSVKGRAEGMRYSVFMHIFMHIHNCVHIFKCPHSVACPQCSHLIDNLLLVWKMKLLLISGCSWNFGWCVRLIRQWGKRGMSKLTTCKYYIVLLHVEPTIAT